MKQLILMLLSMIVVGITSCNQEELETVENDIEVLKGDLDVANNQHLVLLDSITTLIATVEKNNALLRDDIENKQAVDVNAIKMSQNQSLFESMARQPEVADVLIRASENNYTDFTELLPFSDLTLIERAASLAILFEGISRQPEAFEILDFAATQFLGPFDASQKSNDFFINGKARGIALSGLFLAIARQPEAFDILTGAASKFMGDYDSAIFNDNAISVARNHVLIGISEALSRRPETRNLLNDASMQFLGVVFLEEQEILEPEK